jgi:Na+(H+)/acetate symporter ActP
MTPDQSAQLPAIMLSVFSELNRSYAKHGNWQGKSVDEIFIIIHQELLEAHDAMLKKDRDGPHGYRAELCQVMACCAKAILELGSVDNVDNSVDKPVDN